MKAQGIQDGWGLLGVISPSGTNNEYNYVTRDTYIGEKKLTAYLEGTSMLEDWQYSLTEDEIALVNRTVEIRDLVKTEVYATTASLWADDMSDASIRVFNYFDYPEGKHYADHHATAEKIWMPVHKARIKQDIMKGWVMALLVAPYGSDMPYQNITVDLYRSIKDMLTTPYEELMAAEHPGQDLASLFTETEANADLVKREIRILIDQVN